jgi:hypothetical protein
VTLTLATSDTWGIKGSRLYVVSADGSGLSAVPGTGEVYDPAWLPQ